MGKSINRYDSENWIVITGVFLTAILLGLLVGTAYSGQSTITEADGYSCPGYDKSRKQAEDEALANAKRRAAEYACTYMKSETRVSDMQLEKDLIEAYSRATVKVIQELERGWYKDDSSGDCFRVRIKAEIIPDEKAMAAIEKDRILVDDPSAPLSIQVWTDKKEYKTAEKIKIYMRGNKPFYASVLHKDAAGRLLQLLPNPYRQDNYFNGGTIYEIPSGNDRFELEVAPPFGEEQVLVHASTAPLGDLQLAPAGGVYQVKTDATNIGAISRGLKLQEKRNHAAAPASEFFETNAGICTRSADGESLRE